MSDRLSTPRLFVFCCYRLETQLLRAPQQKKKQAVGEAAVCGFRLSNLCLRTPDRSYQDLGQHLDNNLDPIRYRYDEMLCMKDLHSADDPTQKMRMC